MYYYIIVLIIAGFNRHLICSTDIRDHEFYLLYHQDNLYGDAIIYWQTRVCFSATTLCHKPFVNGGSVYFALSR